jgi:hypothetical protein
MKLDLEVLMSLHDQLDDDSLGWLLEEDSPGVRYLAMRDLLGYPANNKDLVTAQSIAHADGPIAEILTQMDEEGFWKKAVSSAPVNTSLIML